MSKTGTGLPRTARPTSLAMPHFFIAVVSSITGLSRPSVLPSYLVVALTMLMQVSMTIAHTMRDRLIAVGLAIAMVVPVSGATQQVTMNREQRRLAQAIARKRYYVVVLEEKGGVGKSLMMQIAYEVVAGPGRKVLVIDADEVNENMKRLGLTTADNIVQAQRVDFEGYLFDAARRLMDGVVDSVVIDSAAGNERYFRQHLPELARDIREAGGRLIVVRPATTNPINLENIVGFGRNTMTDDMGVLMVKNYGQGRTDLDFTIWNTSPERKEMLDRGMVEITLESAGALCSDLATELGIQISHIAAIHPEDLKIDPRKRYIADKYFTDRFRVFVGRWVLRQVRAFEFGFEKALERTAR